MLHYSEQYCTGGFLHCHLCTSNNSYNVILRSIRATTVTVEKE